MVRSLVVALRAEGSRLYAREAGLGLVGRKVLPWSERRRSPWSHSGQRLSPLAAT